MKLKIVAGTIAFFVVIGFAVAAALLGSSLLAGVGSSKSSTLSLGTTPDVTGNPIVRENALPGTNSWQIPPGKGATTQIQAYAGATYALPGKAFTFYVSTQVSGTVYWIDFYRLGWYGSLGGRLVTSSAQLLGQAQGYYDPTLRQLVNCTSCLVDTKTGLVEARWKASYQLTIPTNWTTGVYLAKFTDAKGMQTYVPFDVLRVGGDASAYVVVTPDTTYAAYNDWGGYSLYNAQSGLYAEYDTDVTRGVKVSFDRPYTQENGSSEVLVFEADAIRWMERQGYDLSYISNINVQNNPGQLALHKAYISLGHDEYWTLEMRNAVKSARDKGVGLAFLGAGVSTWQMYLEPDSANVPNHTVVCYKVYSKLNNDLMRDPMFTTDPTRVTAQWRDPTLNNPENSLVGVMYSDLTHKQKGFPWQMSTTVNSPLLKGTGLLAGQSYGCGLVGYEWDSIVSNGASPSGLQVLGSSNVVNDNGKTGMSTTAYYIAASGAMVFATGSTYWTNALDSYRAHVDKTCGPGDTVVPGMQILMAHVMDALIVHH